MKISLKKKIIWFLVFSMSLSVLQAVTVFAKEQKENKDFLQELALDFAELSQQEKYSELLEEFNGKREEAVGLKLFFVDYYLALTKSSYLDYLEKKEGWDDFYAQVDIFDQEIIDALEMHRDEFASQSLFVDLQYLGWKASQRDDSQIADEVFNELVDVVIAYTEQKNDIAKFQQIARLISGQGKVRQLNVLFEAYSDYLIRNNAGASSVERLSEIASDYLREGKVDTAKVVYEHYIDLVLKNYSQAEAHFAMLKIIEKFRSFGFSQGYDADFAESIFKKIDEKLGVESFSESDLLARAYNLEELNDYTRAEEEYKQFAKEFLQSEFLEEVFTRLGIINMYYQGEPDAALLFFNKVVTEFPQSYYADFCNYEIALYYQWKQELDKARSIYIELNENDSDFKNKADARILEINEEMPLELALAYPYDMFQTAPDSSTIVMGLESSSANAFTEGGIAWSGTAQDFSAGTIQPQFKFNWYKDSGSNSKWGKAPELITTYENPYPQVVCFGAKTLGSENAICKSIWIHKLMLNFPSGPDEFKKGEVFQVEVEMMPPTLQASKLDWYWKITGPESAHGNGKNFSYTFNSSGVYMGVLEVSCVDYFQTFNFSFEVVD